MLTFKNGFEYRNSDLRMLNGNKLATVCANLVKIGPVSPEITKVEIEFLQQIVKNWAKIRHI